MLTVQNRAARCKKRHFDTESKKKKEKKKEEDSKVEFFVIRRGKFYRWVSIFVHLPRGKEKKSSRNLVNAITLDKVKGKSCVRPAILLKACGRYLIRCTADCCDPRSDAYRPLSPELPARLASNVTKREFSSRKQVRFHRQ